MNFTSRDITEMRDAVDASRYRVHADTVYVGDFAAASVVRLAEYRARAFQLGDRSRVAHILTARIRTIESDMRLLGFAMVAAPEPPDHDTFAWA